MGERGEVARGEGGRTVVCKIKIKLKKNHPDKEEHRENGVVPAHNSRQPAITAGSHSARTWKLLTLQQLKQREAGPCTLPLSHTA